MRWPSCWAAHLRSTRKYRDGAVDRTAAIDDLTLLRRRNPPPAGPHAFMLAHSNTGVLLTGTRSVPVIARRGHLAHACARKSSFAPAACLVSLVRMMLRSDEYTCGPRPPGAWPASSCSFSGQPLQPRHSPLQRYGAAPLQCHYTILQVVQSPNFSQHGSGSCGEPGSARRRGWAA